MLGAPKHFAIAAAVTAAAGLVMEISSHAAFLTGVEAQKMPLDGLHLLSTGAPLFAIGAVLVAFVPSLTPDPALRKGPAPRAFWALAVGIAARAWAGQLASPTEEFHAALALGGSFVELAALALLVVPAVAPAKAVTAPASLTPSGGSGTETKPEPGS